MCSGCPSKEDGLAVRAEHALERRADLVQRAIRARRLENVRHGVLLSARRIAQRVEGFRAARVVACLAQLLETAPLVAISVLTDLEQRNGQLRLLCHELVDSHDDAAGLFDLPLLTRGGFRDLALDPPRLESLHAAADGVDLLEQTLGSLLQLIRQCLDVIRSAE